MTKTVTETAQAAEPTETALREAFQAFYRSPIYDKLGIPTPPPNELWWAEMRDALSRVLKNDRARMARGEP